LFPNLKKFAIRALNNQKANLIQRIASLRRDRGHLLEKLYLDATSFHHTEQEGFQQLQVKMERLDVWEFFKREALHSNESERFVGPDEWCVT
jgi:hypothetical protein